MYISGSRKVLIAVVLVAAAAVASLFFLAPATINFSTPPQQTTPSAQQPTQQQPSAALPPSSPNEVTIIEADSGESVAEIKCDASCGEWVEGSCTSGEQYLERSCVCADTSESFYESKKESAQC